MNVANDIASNAAHANRRAANIADSMEYLAKDANDVSMRVGAAGTNAGQMGSSTAEVARFAEVLLELVEKFKF